MHPVSVIATYSDFFNRLRLSHSSDGTGYAVMWDLSRKSWDCRFSVKRGQNMNCWQNKQPSLVSTAMLCYYYIRSDWDSESFKPNFHQFFIVRCGCKWISIRIAGETHLIIEDVSWWKNVRLMLGFTPILTRSGKVGTRKLLQDRRFLTEPRSTQPTTNTLR